MNTILDFYNGDIRPFENMCMNRAYYNASAEISKFLRTLEESSSPFEAELAGKLRTEISAIENEAMEIAFSRGFSLGVRLTAECYGLEYEN